jgi:hypothetical protein
MRYLSSKSGIPFSIYTIYKVFDHLLSVPGMCGANSKEKAYIDMWHDRCDEVCNLIQCEEWLMIFEDTTWYLEFGVHGFSM